jgi:hypothetical protein
VIRAAAATPGLGAAAEGRRDGRTMPAELGLDRAKVSVGPPGLSSTRTSHVLSGA